MADNKNQLENLTSSNNKTTKTFQNLLGQSNVLQLVAEKVKPNERGALRQVVQRLREELESTRMSNITNMQLGRLTKVALIQLESSPQGSNKQVNKQVQSFLSKKRLSFTFKLSKIPIMLAGAADIIMMNENLGMMSIGIRSTNDWSHSSSNNNNNNNNNNWHAKHNKMHRWYFNTNSEINENNENNKPKFDCENNENENRHFERHIPSEEGVRHIADALKANTTLHTLFLNEVPLGNKGAKHLAEALKVNTTLRVLILNVNRIGNVGSRHLAAALKVNTGLEELNLRGNIICHVSGANGLASALKVNTTLKKLILADNPITLNRYNRNGDLHTALKGTITLQKLNISRTKFNRDNVMTMQEALLSKVKPTLEFDERFL